MTLLRSSKGKTEKQLLTEACLLTAFVSIAEILYFQQFPRFGTVAAMITIVMWGMSRFGGD